MLDPPKLAEVSASADAFVFPSKIDTLCLVLLEAMTCGLPVAAYPVIGPIDGLDDTIESVVDDGQLTLVESRQLEMAGETVNSVA